MFVFSKIDKSDSPPQGLLFELPLYQSPYYRSFEISSRLKMAPVASFAHKEEESTRKRKIVRKRKRKKCTYKYEVKMKGKEYLEEFR